MLAWVFFRAESVEHALIYLLDMADNALFERPEILPVRVLLTVFVFLCAEWIQRDRQHALEFLKTDKYPSKPLRWTVYVLIIMVIFAFGGSQQEFIYFQF